MAENFGNYCSWKGWSPSNFGFLSAAEASYFEAEIKRSGAEIRSDMAVLEIGFGRGGFLAFCLQNGAKVSGTELHEGLVVEANSLGVDAHQSSELTLFPDQKFDLVAAFDVLEHLGPEELIAMLRQIRRVLRPGGVFISRFPNGDSFAGLVLQNGDLTHRTMIGSQAVHQLAAESGLRVKQIFPEALNKENLSLPGVLLKISLMTLRRVLSEMLRIVFFPRLALDLTAPNLVAVFTRAPG